MIKKGCKFLALFSTILLSAGGIFALDLGKQSTNVVASETPETEYKIVNNYNYRLRRALDKSPDTLEAWIKVPFSSIGGSIASNYMHSHNKYSDFSFGVDALGRLTLSWNDKKFQHTVKGVHVNDNEWHHVAYVRNKLGGEFIFYIDGEEVDRVKSYQKDSLGDLAINIGVGYECFIGSKTPFDGKIKQLTIYNKSLTEEEIEADMVNENIVSTETNNLLGNWVLGEKWTNRYVQDTSDNDNDAYIATYEKYVGVYEADDFDYSMIVVPDIQIMTHFNVPRLRNQAKWMVDNKDLYNLAHVMYVGDLSDVGTMENLYETAADALSQLDGEVDYCFVPGNHDYDDNAATRSTTYFNRHFPASKHSQMPTFGGFYEDGYMENTYYLFEVEGIEYLILNLEYRPRIEIIRWANRICEKYSNRRAIVVSHNIVQPDGNFTPVYGDRLLENLLKKQPNIFMSFSGHIATDDIVMRKDIGEHGNTVTSVLVDLQGSYYQGVGGVDPFLLMKFNEEKKTIQMCYYSPEYDACYNIQNQFTISFADPNNPTIL